MLKTSMHWIKPNKTTVAIFGVLVLIIFLQTNVVSWGFNKDGPTPKPFLFDYIPAPIGAVIWISSIILLFPLNSINPQITQVAEYFGQYNSKIIFEIVMIFYLYLVSSMLAWGFDQVNNNQPPKKNNNHQEKEQL